MRVVQYVIWLPREPLATERRANGIPIRIMYKRLAVSDFTWNSHLIIDTPPHSTSRADAMLNCRARLCLDHTGETRCKMLSNHVMSCRHGGGGEEGNYVKTHVLWHY